jgi:RES domain-containing protein
MTEAGLQGPYQATFEDGLRLLAAALAIRSGGRWGPAAVTAACAAMGCFLKILEAAAERGLPDPDGDLPRLRGQCQALLNLDQEAAEALDHALEAARLARDAAARVLVALTLGGLRP